MGPNIYIIMACDMYMGHTVSKTEASARTNEAETWSTTARKLATVLRNCEHSCAPLATSKSWVAVAPSELRRVPSASTCTARSWRRC